MEIFKWQTGSFLTYNFLHLNLNFTTSCLCRLEVKHVGCHQPYPDGESHVRHFGRRPLEPVVTSCEYNVAKEISNSVMIPSNKRTLRACRYRNLASP